MPETSLSASNIKSLETPRSLNATNKPCILWATNLVTISALVGSKAMLQIEHVKDVLSNAGRTLCVMGKQVKPQLMQNLDDLIAKTQPRLPFDDDAA
ncbi:hypothetical protein [Acinetobacter towneri]|uniref:hypothetical protein n=1 Tax=Acinetobacter towneri TaxID=202956 RepID=UPI001D1848E1|nr:hypothetical protein [Acinetobacter towneri]